MTNGKRILIADDDEGLVDIVARRCEAWGLQVERAYDGMSALQKIEELEPDLVILDVNMPGGSGLSVCEMVSRDLHLKSIPVIILTGRKDEVTIRTCNDLLAHYVPKGPNIWFRLEPVVIDLLGLDRQQLAREEDSSLVHVRRTDGGRSGPAAEKDRPPRKPTLGPVPQARLGPMLSHERARYIDAIFTALGVNERRPDEDANYDPAHSGIAHPWVLCVDDDSAFSDSLKLRLQQHGVEVVQAFAGMAGYRSAFTGPAQAIILDQEMPDGNGDYILRRLKENVVTQDIPVIVLTGMKDRMLERKMYNLGAVRYLTKPVAWDDLWAELRRHIRLTPQPAL